MSDFKKVSLNDEVQAMSDFKIKNTPTGFIWGPMKVTRVCSDAKGGLWLDVETKHVILGVRVSPKGRKVYTKVVQKS